MIYCTRCTVCLGSPKQGNLQIEQIPHLKVFEQLPRAWGASLDLEAISNEGQRRILFHRFTQGKWVKLQIAG